MAMNGAALAQPPGGQAPGGMNPGLVQMLGGQAPPSTPMSDATPDIRKNPTDEWYVAMQKVQIVCRQAMTKADEQDPVVKDFLAAVQQTALKLITVGTMAKPVIAAGLARAFDNFAPQIAQQLDGMAYMLLQQASQPPQGPGGMGAPPPMGQPSMGGPPPIGGGQPGMGGPPATPPGPGGPL